jgi:phosphoribosylglycinamide formyltransferase-1
MNNIAIFASGSGTNAEGIIRFFRPKGNIHIRLVLSNNPDAKVIQRAENLGIDHFIFTRQDFRETSVVLDKLKEYEIDFIVLAGFLWLVPPEIIRIYPNAIVNIHPALLPKYGGKGMYGEKVHKAVLENGEKESGITIHYVNEKYDEGNIIFQAKCAIDVGDSAHDLAMKIHELEYTHFPRVIEEAVVKGRVESRK